MAKARIHYIDALRGVTMLLVVFAHVLTFGFDMQDTFISQLFITFRMPMFFFISGYIAYKGIDTWDAAFFRKMLKKKAVVQIIPATVFWLLFVLFICRKTAPIDYIRDKGFVGYWFTYTLMVFFVIYYTVSLVANKMSAPSRDRFFDTTLCVIAVAGLGIFMALNASPRKEFYHAFSILNVCNYFQYFVFGLLCKRHLAAFERGLRDNRVLVTCMIVFVASLYLLFQPRIAPMTPPLVRKLCIHELVRYSGLLIVFAFFFHNAEFFNKDNTVVRCMLFVGRRTLDIYLIHFFLMPFGIDLPAYAWSNVFVVQLFVATFLSLLVIAVCLLISRIVRMSDFLGHYLLGAKRPEKEDNNSAVINADCEAITRRG